MNKERLFRVILEPQVSEKSSRAADEARQFTFRVLPDATKPEIAAAVAMLFEVEVERVQTVNMKGKHKRFGAVRGRRRDWKKAVVRLKEGHDIDFSVG